MPRDYKRSRTRKKTRTATPPWMWLLGGFGIGLVAALALMHSLEQDRNTPPVPEPQEAMQPQSSRDADAETERDTAASETSRAAPRNTLPRQGKDDYTFYEVLKNSDFVVANDNDAGASTSPPAGRRSVPAAPAKPGTYILQAGSFKNFTDADRRKAELAFQGIESDIKKVELDGAQIWYRVFIGPTSDLAELEDHRTALRRADIDVLLLRKKQ